MNIGEGQIKGALFNVFVVKKCPFCIFQTLPSVFLVTIGHIQASSSEILRILQNTMIVGWYMLHSSTEAKCPPHNCFIMKISEMDCSKQIEIS